MILLKSYRWLSFLLTPFVKLYFFWRLKQGKEHSVRFYERWGKASMVRPQGGLVWVHGASVGESLSALSLLKRLEWAFPKAHFLMTTGTVTSAHILEKRLPPRSFHQFIPVDTPQAVSLFLDHWNPDVALWLESELWPNLLMELKKREKPVFLLNGRMSASSYKRWDKRGRSLMEPLLGVFRKIYVQSQLQEDQFKSLGAQQVEVAANLKFAAEPLGYEAEALDSMSTVLEGRHVWLAASTHKGEEEIVLQAHADIVLKYPHLLTVIVPRHPHRGQEVLSLCQARGLTAHLRTQYPLPLPATQVYIADTLGELGLFYRLINKVFIGGSFMNAEGHNIIEPAHFKCALAQGPRFQNFLDITQQFEQLHAISIVKDGHELARAILDWIAEPGLCASRGQAAYDLVTSADQIMDHIVEDVRGAMAAHVL